MLKAGPCIPEIDGLEAAVAFALNELEPFEALDFLRDYTKGLDITHWLTTWMEDKGCQHFDVTLCMSLRTKGEFDHDRGHNRQDLLASGIP